jgi:vancomycin resistance protein YoaR
LTAYARLPEGVISNGVHVAGMDWGNKPTTTARAELEGWSKARLDEPVVLALPAETKITKQWKPTRAELGAAIDADATLSQAEQVGRDEGAFTRLTSWFTGHKETEIKPVWKVDSEKARKYLIKHILPGVGHKQRDAKFLATQTGFKIIPDQPGTSLDVDASLKAITDHLPGTSTDPVELPVKTVPPHVTSEDLKDIEGEIGSFKTHYSETGNRCRNIVVACSHINGTVLKPGDVFSYNKIVGPREAEGGFKMAPVIVKGKLVPGMGGGICQTSSTLYNAVLLSGLKIVQREHHAFPVHYLPAGRDATVSYGSLDFKFQNNTGGVIAIGADGSGNQVHMRIFGKKVPGREIKIERTNVSSWGQGTETVHDPSVGAGVQKTLDKGHAGHHVTVWRSFIENGVKVKREMVSRDTYQAFPRLVIVGTKASKKPAIAPGIGGSTTQPPPTNPNGAGTAPPQ